MSATGCNKYPRAVLGREGGKSRTVMKWDRDMYGQDKSLGCSSMVPLPLYQGPSFPSNPLPINYPSQRKSINQPCWLFLARPVLKVKAVAFKFNAMCDWRSKLRSKTCVGVIIIFDILIQYIQIWYCHI